MARTEKGQATAELIAGLWVLSLFLPALLAVSYLAGAHLWIQYQLEQATVCAAGSSSRACQRRLNERVREFLPWGTWTSSLTRGPSGPVVHAEFLWRQYRWAWNQQLNLEKIARGGSRRSQCSSGFPCSSRWPQP